MSAIFFLIGCSVFMALIFLGAFFWANKSGQHEDTHTPAMRILFEDSLSQRPSGNNNSTSRPKPQSPPAVVKKDEFQGSNPVANTEVTP